ncbi:hypothetical protein MIS45_08290 [Wielerella bovis]|uniref:hypothetical protein n=1 Tax=Wielerella bovis TaxID=2917790 RepID=UPI00201883EE|nr:hypothetical protein [Wielerella bovis]ULJ68775.1 hypothetical protein MIS45_08290 [Wielerella bovis]
MLGLAILFGLFVWIVVTLIATIIGYKIGKAAHYPKMGALAGFMLTMGGWIVYWAIEFAYIQAQVTKLCEKEAGITIYVTPEQWREQIGEEEWEKMRPLTDKERNERYFKNNKNIFHFNNKSYKYAQGQFKDGNIQNEKLTYYNYFGSAGKIKQNSFILVDDFNKQVVLQGTYFLYIKKFGDIKIFQYDCISDISRNFYSMALKYSYHNEEFSNE